MDHLNAWTTTARSCGGYPGGKMDPDATLLHHQGAARSLSLLRLLLLQFPAYFNEILPPFRFARPFAERLVVQS
jgi:hypothetical protein